MSLTQRLITDFETSLVRAFRFLNGALFTATAQCANGQNEGIDLGIYCVVFAAAPRVKGDLVKVTQLKGTRMGVFGRTRIEGGEFR